MLGAEAFPGLNVSTDAQILSLIQHNAVASYHASATSAMGMANKSMAVLDSKARVFGVYGLRVVDASAFPVLPSGHPSSSLPINSIEPCISEPCPRLKCSLRQFHSYIGTVGLLVSGSHDLAAVSWIYIYLRPCGGHVWPGSSIYMSLPPPDGSSFESFSFRAIAFFPTRPHLCM